MCRSLEFQFNDFKYFNIIEKLMKCRFKVKSCVHLNTLQPLLQRTRGIVKANNKLYFYMIIPKE